jgi:hypothetical protein
MVETSREQTAEAGLTEKSLMGMRMLASPLRLGAYGSAKQLRCARTLAPYFPSLSLDSDSGTSSRGLHSSSSKGPLLAGVPGRASPIKALKEGQVRLLKSKLLEGGGGAGGGAVATHRLHSTPARQAEALSMAGMAEEGNYKVSQACCRLLENDETLY